MIQSGLVVALATLAVGLAIAFALRALPTLRLRLVGLAVLAVCLPLVVVLASGWVMFHMGDDVKILAVAAASASAAVIAALLLTRKIAAGIDRLRLSSSPFPPSVRHGGNLHGRNETRRRKGAFSPRRSREVSGETGGHPRRVRGHAGVHCRRKAVDLRESSRGRIQNRG